MNKGQAINPLDILVRLNWGEGDDIEFKSARGGLVQEGQDRWSRYLLPEASHCEHTAMDSVHKAADSEHYAVDSVHMVAHGLLRLRYPDKPNRTDQAYTANV